MKAKEALIAWVPDSDKVRVGSMFNDLTWADEYQMTGGAAYAHVRKMSPDQAKTYLYITAVHLIVRDGVDPIAVHNAFFNINEYRDGLATDFCHKL